MTDDAFEVFDSTIRAKHFILQVMYKVALSSWQTHEDLGKKADELRDNGEPQLHDLTIKQTVKLSNAQDLANAFVLIVDYSLPTILERGGP